MTQHRAIAPGRAAVITGGAGGIGLATAQCLLAAGMRVCLADRNEAALAEAAASLGSPDRVLAVPTDIAWRSSLDALAARAVAAFGPVSFLMNNAGIEGGGELLGDPARWAQILDVNLWGVIHGVQAFLPGMLAGGVPFAVVNTGSKQGITCPPGDTAYNLSKAGVKVVTEALAHELRARGADGSAHLLIPGFTFTALTRHGRTEKPPAAWTPEQVADFLLAAMARDEFYVLCPDNDVDRATDAKRIAWAAGDIIENRPALSRWHPAYEAEFARFMRGA